jgi:BMFP domain-containing protein YqiC
VWGRLAKEREENSTLRRRVDELEEAVEGALSVVDGPWGV